jgi:hypothetical protein
VAEQTGHSSVSGIFSQPAGPGSDQHSYKKDLVPPHHRHRRRRHAHLRFDRLRQSAWTNEPDRMVFHYTQYLYLAMAFHDNPNECRSSVSAVVSAAPVPSRLSHLRDRCGRARPRSDQRRQVTISCFRKASMQVQAVDGRIFPQKTLHRHDVTVLDAH